MYSQQTDTDFLISSSLEVSGEKMIARAEYLEKIEEHFKNERQEAI
jgi:hypothetical protein